MSKAVDFINVGYFYIGWSTIAYLAKMELGIWTVLVAVGAVFLQVTQGRLSEKSGKKIFLFAFMMSAFGFLLDTVLNIASVVHFRGENEVRVLSIPIWMFSVWILFATVIPSLVKPFYNRPVLGAAMASIGAPLSYVIAEKIELLHFKSSLALVVYGLFWLVFFYVSIIGVKQIEREERQKPTKPFLHTLI